MRAVSWQCSRCRRRVMNVSEDDFPITCTRCKIRYEWPNGVVKGSRGVKQEEKDDPQTDCAHRGEEVIRQEECRSCKKPVMIKVFTCELLVECTIGKKVGSIPCCGGCDRYVKKPKAESV